MRWPGNGTIILLRREGATTRFPGVRRLGEGRYHVRFKITNPKTGRTKEVERIFSNCANAAQAAKHKEDLRETMQSEVEEAERIRLADFAENWLSGKRMTLKPSTLDRYVTTLDLHVLPHLGDYFVDAITHNDLVSWRNAARKDAQASTVNSWLRVVKSLFVDATVQLRLQRNPAQHIEALPEDKPYTDENPNCLTADELAAFLDAARKYKPKWFPLFATLAFTGMRVGEATALKWTDISQGSEDALGRSVPGRILVRRAHWRGKVGTTKTDSIRSVPLPEELASILRDHLRTLEAHEARGLDIGWVFPNAKGGPTGPTSVRKPMMAVIAALETSDQGITSVTVHGLRRTLNNLLRQAVHDKAVARAVTGHVTERMQEHYSHIDANEKAAALAQVVSIVRRPKRTEGAANEQAEVGSTPEVGVLVGVGS